MYTKAPLNHVSVAFDPALQEVYSFGQKPSRNPSTAGFMREEVERDLLRAMPALFVLFIHSPMLHLPLSLSVLLLLPFYTLDNCSNTCWRWVLYWTFVG